MFSKNPLILFVYLTLLKNDCCNKYGKFKCCWQKERLARGYNIKKNVLILFKWSIWFCKVCYLESSIHEELFEIETILYKR